MVAFKYYILIILFFFLSCQVFPQDNQIEAKKLELGKLKDEITKLEKELAQKKAKEKKSLKDYENISKQSFLVNKLIANLRSEENQKQLEINKTLKEIKSIETTIDVLQNNYAKYVVSNYKHGSYTDWESVLNASSFQQAVIRLEYLKRFSARRKIDLVELEDNRKNLIVAKEKLEKEKAAKAILSAQKENEENVLNKKMVEKKKILNAIKKDKNKLTASVKEKRKSEQKIKDLIMKLVEEAEKRREEEIRRSRELASKENKSEKTSTSKEYNFNLSTSKFASFSELKGKLNWPISKGRIVRKFGENKNSKLNTVTLNYGIDIKAAGDLSVKCIAEGVVSAVEWLPGYGTVLIISHNGNYRTVYGHLSEIYVNEGDKIQAGGVIGNVGESLEGNILHFEIWSARQNVNPELWLRK